MSDYSNAVGARLRAIRAQQGLSLHAVEERSHGRWKAVVVGSYERGDRALSVQRLAELAAFYGVPVTELLPAENAAATTESSGSGKLIVDLSRLTGVPGGEAAPLARYIASIQSMRGDYNGRMLSIRAEDLRALSIMYDKSQDDMIDQLAAWGVLVGPTDDEDES